MANHSGEFSTGEISSRERGMEEEFAGLTLWAFRTLAEDRKWSGPPAHTPEAEKANTRHFAPPSHARHFLPSQTHFLKRIAIWLEVQGRAGAVFTKQACGDDRVAPAVRCLKTAPLGADYPRETLPRETRLSEAHPDRLFLAAYGITTRRSWESHRLNEARRCLEASRLPIKQIAFRLGFRADAHFTTRFKKLTNKRPNEYQKLIAPPRSDRPKKHGNGGIRDGSRRISSGPLHLR